MDSPAAAAHRLLIGSGLGLLLVSGLALQRGMLDITAFSLGWLVPTASAICIVIGIGIGNVGMLSGLFPDEDEKQLLNRVKGELDDKEKEDHVGGAWAKLEANLLSKELGEDE